MNDPKILTFPSDNACFPSDAHRLSQGGMPMNATHQHPAYASEKERLEQLQALKRACSLTLCALRRGTGKSA